MVGLGEALLALGQPGESLAALTNCIEAYPLHPATYRARWLASLALQEQGKLTEAAELLIDNLYRHALAPQSSEWRDSLFSYGLLKYRQALEDETQSRLAGIDRDETEAPREALLRLEQSHASFQEAARALKEAVQRYPTASLTAHARYCIAESYRHSAKWPRKRLSSVTIETTRVALNRQVQEELLAALDQYGGLIAELSSGQVANQSGLEMALLRNCYFGRADALFDLGRYDEATQAYSAATNRYQHEPESLEAYVQIASCYRRLNRPAEARGTLEQARVVLQRIRPDADFTRTTRSIASSGPTCSAGCERCNRKLYADERCRYRPLVRADCREAQGRGAAERARATAVGAGRASRDDGAAEAALRQADGPRSAPATRTAARSVSRTRSRAPRWRSAADSPALPAADGSMRSRVERSDGA